MQDQQENKQMHPGQIFPIQHLSIAFFPVDRKTPLWAPVIDGGTLRPTGHEGQSFVVLNRKLNLQATDFRGY